MWVTVEPIWTDLRYTLRLFRKAPFSTASFLLVLAFGLGLHVAVFAFYRTFFLAPVPGVQAPDRLAVVAGRGSLGGGRLPISAGAAAAWLIHLRLAGLLFEPENQGLQVAVWAAALTLSAALLSTGFPALRWSRPEPALKLRYEA
jgi:hypothetical protein